MATIYNKTALNKMKKADLIALFLDQQAEKNQFVLDSEEHEKLKDNIVYLKHQKSILSLSVFIGAALLFSFNSNDLWGKELSDLFDTAGVLGIGNLLFISGYLIHVKFFKK